eukprot:15100318-Ditylum_brightwellii.AAC.1
MATNSHTSSGLNQMRVDGRKEESLCVINLLSKADTAKLNKKQPCIGTVSTGKATPPSKRWHHQSDPSKADGSHGDKNPNTTNDPSSIFDKSPPPSTSSEEQEGGTIGKDITNHSTNSNSTITTADLTEDEDEDEDKLESTMPDDVTQNKIAIENIAK